MANLTDFRFSLFGRPGYGIPDYDTVQAESYDEALWEIVQRYGSGIMVYRVNLDNNGLYTGRI